MLPQNVDSNTSIAVYGSATATDACGTVAIMSMNSFEETCGETRIITRTWNATDECGNSSTCDQIITVVDTTPPSLTVAEDLTLECDEDVPAPSYTASDVCGDVEVTVTPAFQEGCGSTYVMIRTYTATDECGNSTVDTQTITVVDTTDPELVGVPADLTIQCNEEVPEFFVTATDNCDDEVKVEVAIDDDSRL